MGHYFHHAIVVTSWKPEAVVEAHAKAVELGMNPGPIVPCEMNGETSFLIPPDGSKEGWEASENGDKRRAAWKRWAREANMRSVYFDWVEVGFGGDAEMAIVQDHGDLEKPPEV